MENAVEDVIFVAPVTKGMMENGTEDIMLEAPVMKGLMENVEEIMFEAPVMKGVERGWLGREDDRCLYFRMDMPGLGEEHIKVGMEEKTNTLVIKGEIREDNLGFETQVEEDEEEVVVRKYKASIEIPPDFFKTDSIKSWIKNGVLTVLVPKLKTGDGAGNKFGWLVRLIKFNIPDSEENPFLQERDRRDWCAEIREGSLALRIDMPGVDGDDVSVGREFGIDDETGYAYGGLVIEGRGKKESEYEGGGTRHIICKIDDSKFDPMARIATMSNGVYFLAIPPPSSKYPAAKYRR